MNKKTIENNLVRALLENGPMSMSLYEYELEKHIEEYLESKRRDGDRYFFSVTANDKETAMLLIDEGDQVHVNAAARSLLKKLWQKNYKQNAKMLIPDMASELDKGFLFVAGVTVSE